jgi:uncharacterized protein involved in exopolysaccharide biosynthesis
MSESKDKKTPRDLLRAIFQRVSLFLIGAGLVGILVAVFCHYLPKSYTSRRTFQRRDKARIALGPKAEQGASFGDVQRSTVETELKRPENVEAAAESIGMLRDLPRDETGEYTSEGLRMLQERVEKWRSNISVKPVTKTAAVDEWQVSFTHDDPEKAAEFVNALTDEYINDFTQWMFDELKRQVGLREEEEKDAYHKYVAAQHNLTQFQDEHPHVTEDLNAIKAGIEDLERRREDLKRELDLARFKLQGLETEKKDIEESVSGPPVKKDNAKAAKLYEEITKIEEELERSRDSLHNMKTINRMTDAHPNVIKMKDYIADQESRIAALEKELDEIPDVQREGGRIGYSLTLDLKLTRTRIESLENDLKLVDEKLASRNRARTDYNRYSEDYEKLKVVRDTARKRYDDVQSDLLDLKRRLNEEVGRHRTRLESISMAKPQQKPSSPKFLMVAGGSILLGLAAGAGLVFLGHLMDRTISTPEEASRYFGVPIHGVIGEIVTPAQKRYRKLRTRFLLPLVGVVLGLALMLALMSNYLRLEKPDRYQEWTADPVHFMSNRVVDPILRKITGD